MHAFGVGNRNSTAEVIDMALNSSALDIFERMYNTSFPAIVNVTNQISTGVSLNNVTSNVHQFLNKTVNFFSTSLNLFG